MERLLSYHSARRSSRLVCLCLVAAMTVLAASAVVAAEPPADDAAARRAKLAAVTSKLTDHEYLLRYKFIKGDTVRYEVVHQVAVDTTVQGVTQESKSRSRSLKVWKINETSPTGNTVFSHSLAYVNMWSETSGRKAIRYDSRKDDEVPIDYESVAKMVGKPLSMITVDVTGRVIDRQDRIPQFDLGTGGITVPLPDKAVKIGAEWSMPSSLRVRQKDGLVKEIKIRQLYRLAKVETGIATISVRTEVLTPVNDARVKSQLLQRLSNGEIKFDISAGGVVSRQLDWNETVVGFNGPESNMSYLARLTEKRVSDRVAAASK